MDKKEVLAVECKNKVHCTDIIKFGRKCEILKAKFEKDAEIWGYKLTFESWLVACFGCDDQTNALAKAKAIVSIDPPSLRTMLKENNLYDPHAIICPSEQ